MDLQEMTRDKTFTWLKLASWQSQGWAQEQGEGTGILPSEGEMMMIDTDMNPEWLYSVKTMTQPSPNKKKKSKQHSEEIKEGFTSLNMSHILPNKKGS